MQSSSDGSAGAVAGKPLSPSGTISFLFTDIEASTRRWERDAVAMSEALRRHDALLRATVEANAGFVFKTVGDAFCCAFSDMGAAVAAANASQHALASQDFSAIDGLRVRMALHAGTAHERDGDYFGPAVNRVARLLAVAHGGQVVLSEAAAALARATVTTERLVDLGSHRLKDLDVAERVYQLALDDLPNVFPPLRSLNVLDNNLPFQITRLVGHNDELKEIERLVRERRLVTLAGTGGVGKTRLALQVGANLVDGSADGVWFVNLAAIREASLVASAVAVAVGAPLPADGDLLEALVVYLKLRRLLLVVDNCEHVIDEVARVIGKILDGCGDIYVIATSREPLNLRGEYVYRIPSLPVPGPEVTEPSEVLRYPACELFVQRATSANRTFACTHENAFSVAEICRRLDGIPLAIELAAARTNVLSASSVLRRLDERFRVLTGDARGTLPRQQTMRALIDWSYDLLELQERRTLMLCAVFAGGWTMEAAEALCAASGETCDVLETLGALVDKSLVVVDLAQGARSRFALLESMRAYAFEKLVVSGKADSACDAHAAWLATKLESARTMEPTQRWLAEIRPEVDNILVGLVWTLGRGDDPVLAGRIASDAGRIWYEGGFASPGRRYIEMVLTRLDPAREPAIASWLWQSLATLRFANGSADAARHALAFAEAAGDEAACAGALIKLGFGLWQAGRPVEALTHLERAIALHGKLGTSRSTGYASARDALGNVLVSLGRIADARREFDEATAGYASLGDRLGAALVQGNLAELDFACGDAAAALARVAGPIAVFREMKATVREATAMANRAGYLIALDLGDGIRGARLDEARSAALEALALGRRAHNAQIVAISLQHVATVAAFGGQAKLAARLLGYVDEWYRNEGYERESAERASRDALLAALSTHLSTSDVEGFISIGATLSESDAVEEVAAPADRSDSTAS